MVCADGGENGSFPVFLLLFFKVYETLSQLFLHFDGFCGCDVATLHRNETESGFVSTNTSETMTS